MKRAVTKTKSNFKTELSKISPKSKSSVKKPVQANSKKTQKLKTASESPKLKTGITKTQARAGESFEVQAFVRTNGGKMFVQKIPVKIPADTPSGMLMVSVGDGNSMQQNAISQQFVPKDLAQLIKTINEIKKNDRLYVQTYRVTNGAVIGANELPNLPPSVLATLNNDRTAGGFKPTVQTVLTEQEIIPAEFVISGQQTLAIEIIK